MIYFGHFGGAGGHRYWRINMTANAGNAATQFVEVEMRESIGGADVTGSGTPSAGGGFTGGTVASAFDNNTGTAFVPTGAAGWLKYDFGAGNGKNIVEIGITAVNSTFSTLNAAPQTFTIEWSDDDSSWTTLGSTVNEYGWLYSKMHSFPQSAPAAGFHKFWRVFCLNNNGGTSSILLTECQMRATSAGVDQTGVLADSNGDATGRAIMTSGDGNAWQMFDGVTATGGWSGAATTNRWFGHVFPTAVKVEEIVLTCTTNTARAPNDIRVEYSDDAVTWTSQKAINDLTWSSTETKTLAAI